MEEVAMEPPAPREPIEDVVEAATPEAAHSVLRVTIPQQRRIALAGGRGNSLAE